MFTNVVIKRTAQHPSMHTCMHAMPYVQRLILGNGTHKRTHALAYDRKRTGQTNESAIRTMKLISFSIESMNILSIAFIGVFIGEIIFCIPYVPFDLCSPFFSLFGSASHNIFFSIFLFHIAHSSTLFVVRIFSSLSSIFYGMVAIEHCVNYNLTLVMCTLGSYTQTHGSYHEIEEYDNGFYVCQMTNNTIGGYCCIESCKFMWWSDNFPRYARKSWKDSHCYFINQYIQKCRGPNNKI